jgi:hypothetical protein
LTRLVALMATMTLALAVQFRSPADSRLAVCIIVSLAAVTLVSSCLFGGKVAWALPFLVILGLFTPFQIGRFSHELMSILDMATLALFAAAPVMLRKSTMTVTRVGRL